MKFSTFGKRFTRKTGAVELMNDLGAAMAGEAHWPHRDQCLRLSYARDEEIVRRGIAILGDEVRRWQP